MLIVIKTEDMFELNQHYTYTFDYYFSNVTIYIQYGIITPQLGGTDDTSTEQTWERVIKAFLYYANIFP